ncbi:MAG TPA: PDZ domain-containing protein, partial [Terracidiphilus sp.]|nr:PDZ domain-containing protein [Terracidiphilus sp.]
FLRDGKPSDTTVPIGDRDQVFAALNGPVIQGEPEQSTDAGETKLGIVVRDASQQTAGKVHTPGVIVESVRTGSFADLQGLEPGLLIIRINKQPTANRDQYEAVVNKLKTGDDVVFEVIDPKRPADGINYIGGTLQ